MEIWRKVLGEAMIASSIRQGHHFWKTHDCVTAFLCSCYQMYLLFVNSAWTTESSPSETVNEGITSAVNDGAEIRHNFQNLFNSIAKNETDERERYREVLKQEIERGQENYDVMEGALLTARISSVKERRDSTKLYKRESFGTRRRKTYDRDEDFRDRSRDEGSRYTDRSEREVERKPEQEPEQKPNDLRGNMTLEERQFFHAVAMDDVDTVKRLLDANVVNLTTREPGNRTAASLAAGCGNLRTLKYLLNLDRSLLNIRDGFDYTLLHRAIERGFLNLTKCLLDEYGADLTATVHETYGNTVLHIAAASGELDMLRYLIEEKRMDPNLKNFYGQPPGFAAASNKKLKSIRYLAEELRANLSMVDSRNDNILFISLMRRDLRIPRYLLDDRRLNFDINWRGYGGKTLVLLSARIRALNFIKYLVDEKKANVSIADDEGMTPLHQAAQYNNLLAVKFLVSHKAKTKVLDSKGKMPVDLATDAEVISYLQMVMRRRGRMK